MSQKVLVGHMESLIALVQTPFVLIQNLFISVFLDFLKPILMADLVSTGFAKSGLFWLSLDETFFRNFFGLHAAA